MIHRVSARVSAGSDQATFKVRLPPGGKKHQCNVQSLHAQLADQHMEYRMRLTVKREDAGRFHSTYFTDPMGDGKTSATFAAALNNHNGRIREKFSTYALRWPHMELSSAAGGEDDEEERRWTVRLPPGSFLYTDAGGAFWGALGFQPEHVASRTVRFLGLKSEGDVWGFWNNTANHLTYYSSPVHGGEMIGILAKIQNGGTKIKTRVNMELGWESTSIFPLRLAGARGMTKTEAVHALSEMVDRSLKLAAVDDRAISIRTGDDGEIEFESRALPDCGVTLEMQPQFPLDEFLRAPGLRLIFPLSDDRSYSFRVRRMTHDPLDDFFPISIVSISAGSAVHYIEGFGKVALLAHLISKDNCFAVAPVELQGDVVSLTVFLIDKNLVRIRFKENMILYLSFDL